MSFSAIGSGPRCSIQRSLEILGERWTLLIVRDAFRGRSRFSEFKEHLGVSSDVLTDRLSTLVESGLFERRAYRESGARERYSYHLTDRGRDLLVVLGAIAGWGDVHRPSGFGPATVYRRTDTGEPVSVAFVDSSGCAVEADRVESAPGPGADY